MTIEVETSEQILMRTNFTTIYVNDEPVFTAQRQRTGMHTWVSYNKDGTIRARHISTLGFIRSTIAQYPNAEFMPW